MAALFIIILIRSGNETSMLSSIAKRCITCLILGGILFCSSCGYHLTGSVRSLPAGIQSLGIPTFKNNTREYKLEQQITAAVLKEFTLRTRVPVNSNSTGVDAVLIGEIQNLSSNPITFNPNAFASAFMVTVDVSIKLVRLKDHATIWENPSFSFRAQYVLNSKVTQFFSEENAAVERLARDLAASLASSILAR
jgi:hypothetical protein